MAQRNVATVPEVPPPEVVPEVQPETFYVTEIPETVYKDRTYYAARDRVHDRNGILRQLRAALSLAELEGRTVSVSIAIK